MQPQLFATISFTQKHLKSIVLPDKLTNVSNDTFSGCTELETVTIENHVVSAELSIVVRLLVQ